MGGKKTAWKIVREAISNYRSYFKVLFITTLIIYGAGYLWSMLTNFIVGQMGLDSKSIQAMLTQLNQLTPESNNDAFVFILPLLLFIGSILVMILSSALTSLLMLPNEMISVSGYNVMLQMKNGNKPSLSESASDFLKNWKRYLGISAWSTLWIFLWSLVFIIPGIVKTFSYRMAPFLVLQYPEMSIREALKKSNEITTGYRARLFGMGFILALPLLFTVTLTFIILAVQDSVSSVTWIMRILTPVLNLFLVQPISFMMTAIAYLDIKQAAIENGQLPPNPIQIDVSCFQAGQAEVPE